MIFKIKHIAVWISSVLVLMIVTSCFNQTGCKKVVLSKEEMEWFQNFTNGDTVFFKSQGDEIDTFVIEVSEEVEYTTCNKFELGDYIYPLMFLRYQNIDSYRIKNRRDYFYLEYSKSINDLNAVKCDKLIKFFELDVRPFNEFDESYTSSIKNPFGNDSILEFRFLLGKNAVNNEGLVNNMQQFAISKEYGLMWYKTIKGDLYQRIW